MLATIDSISAHDQEGWDKWLASEVQAAIDDPGPSIPHEEVMQRMATRLMRLKLTTPPPARSAAAGAR